MSILDNKVAYGILPGNHDMAPGGGVPKYENHFPASRYEGYSYWGGSYNHNKNNYQLFSAGGMDFITLNLEYRPPDHVLDWADNVLDNYPNRRAIISTHQFLKADNTRNDPYVGNSEGNNGGQSIWDNLVVPHNNVFLVLCGHLVEEAKRSDTVDDRTVHQLLSDYQFRPNGGNGWLRIMEFVPNEDKIYVRTYSPYLDQYETDENSQFELSYPMDWGLAVSTLGAENVGYTSADIKGELENLGGASSAEVWFQWRESGTPTWENTSKDNLPSPQEFSESLSSLSEGTTYEFRAVADNSTDVDYGGILTFETLIPLSWWSYRKEITIDHTKVDDNLENFPLLINIVDPDLKVHAMNNGGDILFTKSDGETKIPHEIELYDSSNGHLVAHVRAPYLSAVENTIIFIYYGNPGASNQENPTGVWDSNFVMVQHLEEPSGTIYDSTSYGNDGTTSGNPTYGASGQIDGAIGFDGIDDSADCGNDSSVIISGDVTISAWIKFDSLPTENYAGIVIYETAGETEDTNQLYQINAMIGEDILLGHEYGGGVNQKYTFDTNLSSGTWYHLSAVRDDSAKTWKLYLDGSQFGSPYSYTTSATGGSSSRLHIGYDSAARYFNGPIDEVRISNVARSVKWISTTFNNENSPSTFYSVGEEAIIGLAVSTLGAENIGYTSADIRGELENLGGASSAEVWFQWRESGTPTWENTSKDNLPSPQEFSESLSSLSEGTTYEFRAVADNSTDVDYGNILTFETLTHVSWWDYKWEYRKEITIDHAKVYDNLDNFPLLIDIIDSDLKAHAMDNGDDILFTKSDGETKIPHEIELYESSNGHLVAHVRIPYLSGVENTIIYMYYGNPGASNQEDATGVWDENYVMVQHLEETSGTHYDSTSNRNNGTPYGGVTQDAAGKINGADEFDGENDWVGVSNPSFPVTDELTVSAWIKPKQFKQYAGFVHKSASTGTKSFYFGGAVSNWETGKWRFTTFTTSGRVDLVVTGTLTLNEWNFIVGVYDGSKMKSYLNGSFVNDISQSGNVTYDNTEITIGVDHPSFGTYENGIIDEVRISNLARSAEWISTTFNNENSPSTFYSVGSEEAIVRGVEVSIEPKSQFSVIGENVVFTVTVKNTGNIWENYKLENNDDAGWTLKLDNDYLEIPENENRETKLTVTIPDNENLVCTTDNITVVATAVDNAEVTDNDNVTVHAVPSWTGTVDISLLNLYTFNVEKILDLNLGSKLVVKFYTYGDAFENENVVETFSPPWQVEENESARHPEGVGVKKARLDLTTDDTENVISTIASFTVRRVNLEVRFTEIPLEWALASPEEKVALEIEFSEIPLYWALAPS